MVDKRILKTKKNLQETLIAMMVEMPFKNITVSALCDKANTSRVTFYSYYGDKYDLINEILDESGTKAEHVFKRLQMENNKEDDLAKGFCNLLDSILDMVKERRVFFGHINVDENTFIYYYLYSRILSVIEKYTAERFESMSPNYSMKQTASFLLNGLIGFIQAGRKSGMNDDAVRSDAKKLLLGMLKGPLFKA